MKTSIIGLIMFILDLVIFLLPYLSAINLVLLRFYGILIPSTSLVIFFDYYVLEYYNTQKMVMYLHQGIYLT